MHMLAARCAYSDVEHNVAYGVAGVGAAEKVDAELAAGKLDREVAQVVCPRDGRVHARHLAFGQRTRATGAFRLCTHRRGHGGRVRRTDWPNAFMSLVVYVPPSLKVTQRSAPFMAML